MPEIDHEGKKISLDNDGFLVSLEDWTEAVARILAEREGIAGLSEDQLDILKFLRTYYREASLLPDRALRVQKRPPAG